MNQPYKVYKIDRHANIALDQSFLNPGCGCHLLYAAMLNYLPLQTFFWPSMTKKRQKNKSC